MLPASAQAFSGQPFVVENEWVALEELLGDSSDEDIARFERSTERASRQLRKALGTRGDPLELRTVGGRTELRAAGIAGTLGLGQQSIDVAPKFVRVEGRVAEWDVSTLLLLQHASRRNLAYRWSVGLRHERRSFVDHLALAFADAVEAGLADQVIETYGVLPESSPALRGRLSLRRQMRHILSRPHRLECDVDQLDSDNEYNRRLAWAASAFAGAVRSASIRRLMLELGNRLPTPRHEHSSSSTPRSLPPPQFRIWNDALEIAELLASGLTHTGGGGRDSGYSFVFNMERLFEQFVEDAIARVLARSQSGTAHSLAQESARYAEPADATAKALYSRPDNVVLIENRARLIIDAKYKRLSDGVDRHLRKPNNADVYELIAAMTAHDCLHGLLIYPRILGDSELPDGRLRTWFVNAFGTRLHVSAVGLDLGGLRRREDLDRLDSHLSGVLGQAVPDLLEAVGVA